MCGLWSGGESCDHDQEMEVRLVNSLFFECDVPCLPKGALAKELELEDSSTPRVMLLPMG